MIFAEECRTFGIILLCDAFAVVRPRLIDRIFYKTVNDVYGQEKELFVDLLRVRQTDP